MEGHRVWTEEEEEEKNVFFLCIKMYSNYFVAE